MVCRKPHGHACPGLRADDVRRFDARPVHDLRHECRETCERILEAGRDLRVAQSRPMRLQPRFQRPHATSLDATSGSSYRYTFLASAEENCIAIKRHKNHKNFCDSCAFLWPFLFLYTALHTGGIMRKLLFVMLVLG